ncbi:hypothetical protein AC1031_014626 [Aphanomyces cochlioides]|nr:hypothetical protein AC1031_014626 [Aphanomyces cochlioides]
MRPASPSSVETTGDTTTSVSPMEIADPPSTPQDEEGSAVTTSKTSCIKEEPAVWCDESVAKLFMLRYKSDLTKRFESKNNMQKNYAYECLASELSVFMQRTFTSTQVINKVSQYIYTLLTYRFD